MAGNVYEGMFLLDSNQYARDPNGVARQITEMIENCGGEVLVSRLWADQKLAYQIKGQKKGTYWLTYFRAKGEELGKLNRESQLNNTVVRSLILTIEPRLADALIEHAQGGPAAAESRVTTAPDEVAIPSTDEDEKSGSPTEVSEPELTTADATASATD